MRPPRRMKVAVDQGCRTGPRDLRRGASHQFTHPRHLEVRALNRVSKLAVIAIGRIPDGGQDDAGSADPDVDDALRLADTMKSEMAFPPVAQPE